MRAAWWWIDRWRKSTAYTDMTLAEQGAYRNLLDELWLRGGLLPDDDRVLAKVSGDALEWPKVRAKVMARFQRTPEGWRNETHDEVVRGSGRQAEKGQKRAAAAPRLGGKFTSHAPAGAPAGAPAAHQPPSPSPSPSPSPVGRQEEPTLPPADRAERSIRLSTEALRTKLYGLIDTMAREDPEQADPTELMRMVTAYDKPDGTHVKGVVKAALLTHERLEKSIADAEAQLAEWREAKARVSPAPPLRVAQQP